MTRNLISIKIFLPYWGRIFVKKRVSAHHDSAEQCHLLDRRKQEPRKERKKSGNRLKNRLQIPVFISSPRFFTARVDMIA